MKLNWEAIYLDAEPKTEEDAWRWLDMILGMSLPSLTEEESEALWTRAYFLFCWLEVRCRWGRQ